MPHISEQQMDLQRKTPALCAADGLLVKTLFPITGSIDHKKGFAML